MTGEASATLIAPPIWKDFVAEDEHGPYLVGGQCGKCNFVTLGVRNICPNCWQDGVMSATEIGRRGILYSFTVLHQMASGFDAPCAVGYVDLQDGVRVFAHLLNEASSLQIGSELELELAPLRLGADGEKLIGPRFRAKKELS